MDLLKEKTCSYKQKKLLKPKSPFAMNFRGVTMPLGNA